jgi:LmbE family N-acetylglucosaminyl deacetylase
MNSWRRFGTPDFPPGAGLGDGGYKVADVPERGRSPRVAVIVAHPDDEVLWCGGLLLSRPSWAVFVACLTRGKDPDRAPRFRRVLERYGAQGVMGDLDDGPEQKPLPTDQVQALILALLPQRGYDLILTHSLEGEYTRHRRHEEIAKAVYALCKDETLTTRRLWSFAYEDRGGAYLPRARPEASLRLELSETVWAEKLRLMRDVYNYPDGSWEVQTTPRTEAFQWSARPDSPPFHDREPREEASKP